MTVSQVKLGQYNTGQSPLQIGNPSAIKRTTINEPTEIFLL